MPTEGDEAYMSQNTNRLDVDWREENHRNGLCEREAGRKTYNVEA